MLIHHLPKPGTLAIRGQADDGNPTLQAWAKNRSLAYRLGRQMVDEHGEVAAAGAGVRRLNSLAVWGIVILMLGLVLAIVAQLFPATFPDATEAEKAVPEIYERHLKDVASQIELRRWLWLIGDKLLAAGFLMWLTGFGLGAARRPA